MTAAPAQDLEAVVADGVELGVGEGDVHRPVRRVREAPAEHGDGQARGAGVGGREGRERLQLDADRQDAIVEGWPLGENVTSRRT